MSEQLKKILQSSDLIRKKFPKRFNLDTAVIIEKDFDVLNGFKIIDDISLAEIFPSESIRKNAGKILFAKCGDKDVIIYDGRAHYYDGVSMRDIGHIIYVLKYLGVKKIISIDEAGTLNPRFAAGELALIYDHINLMGDNPLIGKNENELGLRFPDMSNAYNRNTHDEIFSILQENMIKVNDSVYLGITGPESETDAEARFYRDIGADVAGYSVVPENITAVHCGLKFASLCLITRELIADKMMEDDRSEKQKAKDRKVSLNSAEKKLSKVLALIVKKI
ncbi:MAG: purine-nucleoside phosphorylase [bacterium]|nr:purine-nucleoside phosphorylase [bacterium]